MAVVTQTVTLAGWIETFKTANQEPARNSSDEPFGICSFFSDFEIDAIGVGDDATLVVRLDLPPNNAYILKSIAAQIREGSGNDIVTTWRDPVLRMFFAASAAIPITQVTQIDYPVAAMNRLPIPDTTVISTSYIGFGSRLADAGVATSAGYTCPYPSYVTYGRDPGSTIAPAFVMQNITASVGPWDLRFVSEWYCFNIEQTEHSGIYWPQLTRPS